MVLLRQAVCALAALVCAAGAARGGWAADGDVFLVRDGRPEAEIVIAENPPRLVTLAARELQHYIRKISGAELAVVSVPGRTCPVKIYLGRSVYTDRLGFSDAGLAQDAFRIAVRADRFEGGARWLLLLGRDRDYEPVEPWARNAGDRERVTREWDAITGEPFSSPTASTFRGYNGRTGLWAADEGGSLQAVYQFLRDLGVRWYFPGEIGEVVPARRDILLPGTGRVVRPDFAVRNMYFYLNTFNMASEDEVLWQLRLGLNQRGFGGGHGINPVHSRPEVKAAHPEYFALWGDQRALDHKVGGAPCLSSSGLFEANLRYARAVYEHYGTRVINVSPADGYSNLCQCELCAGKGTPERGWTGQMSDYVWDYVDRLARELYRTHPDLKVTGLAYGSYLLPPEKIARFSPNVAVVICQGRARFDDSATRARFESLRASWRAKLPSRELYTWEYYLHGREGSAWQGVPVYFPRLIVEDLRALKGVSRGDFIEVYRNNPAADGWHALAAGHLNIYVTARFLWDAGQDLDALLEEYYREFYGPAAAEMKALVEYAEASWPGASRDVAVIDRLNGLVEAARAAAGGGAYGARVQMLTDYARLMAPTRERLVRGREGVPEAVAEARGPAGPELDGRLDEPFWRGLPVYALRTLDGEGEPAFSTSFQVAAAGDALYFGIRCLEPDMAHLNVGATEDGDGNVFVGDNIELLIETPVHAYYQLAFSPSGALFDLDRAGGIDSLWSSHARAAAHWEGDAWSLEIVLPLAGESALEQDTLNGIAGDRPTAGRPWYFNLGRQRLRGDERSLSIFSPSGESHFHVPLRFGKLVVR